MKMYTKKLKRICDVKGCKNVETYAIGRYKQLGGGPVICKQCLEDALKEVKKPGITDEAKERTVTPVSASLFPRGIASTVKEADVPPADDEHDDNHIEESGDKVTNENHVEGSAVESVEDSEQSDKEKKTYVCKNCGKSFKTEQGLNNHLKNCIKK